MGPVKHLKRKNDCRKSKIETKLMRYVGPTKRLTRTGKWISISYFHNEVKVVQMTVQQWLQ